MRMSSREIAVIGMMLGLSLMLDVVPVEMPTVWGMKIDLVAVPIIMAYLLTGFLGGPRRGVPAVPRAWDSLVGELAGRHDEGHRDAGRSPRSGSGEEAHPL